MVVAAELIKGLVTVATPADDAEDLEHLSLEQLEERIDKLDGLAQKRGREAVLAKVEIGLCLAVRKAQQPKGFVSWAKERWGYGQQYGTTLMFLAANHGRVRDLLDVDPELPLRKVASALKQELKDTTRAPGRAEHVFPVATPADVVLDVLDAGKPLPTRILRTLEQTHGVDLVITSWPYCLGESGHGYVDFTNYDDWLDAATAWTQQMHQVLAPNGRAVINLPIDVRKDQPEPRPIGFDGLRILRTRLRYAATVVWAKSANGQTSNTRKRGSPKSPNAPTLATGDELLLIVHKGSWNLGRPGEPNDLDDLSWTNAHWTIAGRTSKDYPHVMSREVVERCIQLLSYPGALVADFHCGSGTGAVAAMQLGRSFIGGDLNATAVALATRNVQAAYAKMATPSDRS